jgi:hypothetical protein
MFTDDEYAKVCGGTILAYLRIIPRHVSEQTEKTEKLESAIVGNFTEMGA